MLEVLVAFYGLSFILYFVAGRKVSLGLYTCGAAYNLYLVLDRWVEAGHLPFSNMYETLISLGFCVFLLHVITEWGMKVGAPWMDPLIGVVMITGAFFRSPEVHPLMPALQSPLFFPHVFSYVLAYAAAAKGCALAICTLASRDPAARLQREKGTHQVLRVGFPLLTAGLLLGAIWAKLAWGDYWSWDPKEMWSLVTWMVYLGYFHYRYRRGPRSKLVPWLAILGFVTVVITLWIVNLTKAFAGLHSYAGP